MAQGARQQDVHPGLVYFESAVGTQHDAYSMDHQQSAKDCQRSNVSQRYPQDAVYTSNMKRRTLRRVYPWGCAVLRKRRV